MPVQVKQIYKNPQIGFGGTYERLVFPEYTYREFPKWVRKGKKELLVNSKKEELEFLSNTPDEEGVISPSDLHPIQAENIDLANTVAAQQKELDDLRKQLAAVAGMNKPEGVNAPKGMPEPAKPAMVESLDAALKK